MEHVSDTIESDMDEASEEVAQGKNKIDELISQVETSDEASRKVATELDKLTTYASQMQGIVDIIGNITDQTSLLSLNAESVKRVRDFHSLHLRFLLLQTRHRKQRSTSPN
mgnify:CR=1 FL=1